MGGGGGGGWGVVGGWRAQTFQNFVKVLLTKNPKKRPPADKMLEVMTLFNSSHFICQSIAHDYIEILKSNDARGMMQSTAPEFFSSGLSHHLGLPESL